LALLFLIQLQNCKSKKTAKRYKIKSMAQ